ncbi:hypothetical protein THRCLA_22401 [Thraustotheca clavata]|uniref:Uncharacterized protein n=1 Tax=Thraustotheca clavata TaxID=74557 RepID=A0A1V9Z2H2_9STRA|nr:hypothetical protein THRCLA_22401 [Thraustotheca clavata]
MDIRTSKVVGTIEDKISRLNLESRVVGKSDTQCYQKWTRSLQPGIDKSKWSREQTLLLQKTILQDYHNEINWAEISKLIHGKTSKQCKDRWDNHADPSIITTADVPLMHQELCFIENVYHIKYNCYADITSELNRTIQQQLEFWSIVNETLKNALQNPELEPRRRVQDIAKHIKSSPYYIQDSKPGRMSDDFLLFEESELEQLACDLSLLDIAQQ